jgi:LDH2 family malate/lactate/ureidoglycolate dehydrogenase
MNLPTVGRRAIRARQGSALDRDGDGGYVSIVFKPASLVSLDDFKRQGSEPVDRVAATSRRSGFAEIRIPGERAFGSRERARRADIELYDSPALLQG